MVGASGELWPAAVEDPSFMFWAQAPPKTVSGWGHMTNWSIQSESHEDATVEDLGGSPSAAFPLTPGIYKINLQWAVSSSDGLIGLVFYQIGCFNCHQWPSIHTWRTKAKPFYFDNPPGTDPPPLQETMVRWVNPAKDSPGVDSGQCFVVVPGNDAYISVAFMIDDGFSFMCRPTISVSRIN
jgi:hypothetical protein